MWFQGQSSHNKINLRTCFVASHHSQSQSMHYLIPWRLISLDFHIQFQFAKVEKLKLGLKTLTVVVPYRDEQPNKLSCKLFSRLQVKLIGAFHICSILLHPIGQHGGNTAMHEYCSSFPLSTKKTFVCGKTVEFTMSER